MREPHAFAQRDAFQDPDSVSGYESDSFSVSQPDSLSECEPDSVSCREPDSVSVSDPDQVAIATICRGRVGGYFYPASCHSSWSPLGSTMSATGIATSQLGAPSALTRISMTSESRRWAMLAQSLRKANTTGRTRLST